MKKQDQESLQNNPILFGALGLLIGVILTGSFASYAVNSNNRGMMGIMGMGARHMTSVNNVDANFIEQMIPHHESAIAMAELAKEKATHDELKTLADEIIKSQSAEITQMRQWYKDWYGRDVPRINTNGSVMMDSEATRTALQQATDFDKAFLDHMIPHHQMAVMMANMLKLNTERDEMKKLADDIIDAQTKEINNMKDWQQQWGYGSSNIEMMHMMHN